MAEFTTVKRPSASKHDVIIQTAIIYICIGFQKVPLNGWLKNFLDVDMSDEEEDDTSSTNESILQIYG